MRKKTLPYWNHNTAYFPWIAKQIGDRRRILDVGCGDGSLVSWLRDGSRTLVGIDPSEACLRAAKENCAEDETVRFLGISFEEYPAEERFDAVIFSASLHHMDMTSAIRKAVSLLAEGGVLIVVGLAVPSSLLDKVAEGLRVLPCRVLSKLHGEKTSEEQGIPVSYALPSMDAVRETVKKELPDAVLRRGLYYRYLLRYEKKTV